MSDHDLAAAYVLGALEPDEARAFEARLMASPQLQREVAELREVSTLLALGAPPVPRSDDTLKRGLMARIRGDSRSAVTQPLKRRRGWLVWTGWAAAAAVAAVVIVQRVQLGDTRQQLAALEEHADGMATELAERQATLDDVLGPETSMLRLTATGETAPNIQMFWNADANRIVLHASNLPPAPAGRAYQLWFLGADAPVPGGTFDSETDGDTVITLDGPAGGTPFAGAAVTIEPLGGSPAPTSPIILAGEL